MPHFLFSPLEIVFQIFVNDPDRQLRTVRMDPDLALKVPSREMDLAENEII
jgi:hypothetical protein